MSLIKNLNADLNAAQRFGLSGKAVLFLFNRGFHALFWYRIAHALSKLGVPLLPFLLSRFVQILYGIDIDFRAKLAGGIVIVHGVGLVIGQGAVTGSNIIFFHGVTLGRRGIGPVISPSDGFPTIADDCVICAGAKLIGPINIGQNSIIGANCVVSSDLPSNSICKINPDINMIYQRREKVSE